MGKSQDLYRTAKGLIPGGTQLLSKRPEMFLPDLWPAYYSRAKGCEIWDLDGNSFLDMTTMGVGTCVLGYADDDVNRVVKEIVDAGNMSLLNAPEEVALAQRLCALHPWASMARFTRSGGEAMAVAVRLARARTRRDVVLFCGYHGWHDWYLAANLGENTALDGHLLPGLSPRGVPRALRGTSHPFKYNDTMDFVRLMKTYTGEVAAVVIEPVRNMAPSPDFLSAIRQETRAQGAVLVVDEITAGWRLNLGGAHLHFGIEPDLAVFGKALSNGYPLGAVIGKRDVMESAQETFISSTYWTDRIGPAAALATLEKMEKMSVPVHLSAVGKRVQEGWRAAAKVFKIDIEITGILPLSHFSFLHEKALVLKTLFTQEMLDRGFLASTSFYASLAHGEEQMGRYLEAVHDVFSRLAKALATGNPEGALRGPVCHSGFRRLA
ncbi:MAG: aminotransferase class III-fold pyridoxal phosphate-dependent enzyme [Elusimicrobia bacterium]|nr:aminotransferase class III-fold pyridoxal phosphate-dependent enzyme [Elusimicrobiota bacterium]MBK7208247.1 aminotransferase class III-fold pyridoxal phosphate-dependent enzyme [Elusimicrobiota bacterium]MBK7574527.1 aminotransferase class III-fold pyridoxal phosphate-dependent enzyme [Elusimicrobiota bacterium]MBK7688108.1 aminotransferase class III-fold pyridoxal phosphate-dependent enzyme [Elusimicrobiota bacterium]MBK8126673.1 aminotransferase class III-fold pyridoxal phosphate-dependen